MPFVVSVTSQWAPEGKLLHLPEEFCAAPAPVSRRRGDAVRWPGEGGFMRYRRYAPAAALRDVVEHYWPVVSPAPASPVRAVLVPNGRATARGRASTGPS
ncbi:hypothetical protein Ssi02_41910 [Sinosporangium siamense]|uniref:Uncharacterized protein n=2 Tax=Sinosporangium siamense TaxID=1367973 RepID=A0A919V6E1_9ACTN|nr:hypothetical protein Ssi02_41910 [Sinosporangium siamense]